MRNRFIVGAGNDVGGHVFAAGGIGAGYYKPGNIGGEEKHTLTIAEMPSHKHEESIGTVNLFGSGTSYGGKGNYNGPVAWGPVDYTNISGGGQSHTIIPPYYALAYIMKL